MKHIFIFAFLLIIEIACGQEIKNSDFTKEIKCFDISHLWTCVKIQVGNDTTIDRPEPLGFIGENYQRLHIHFISVIQNPSNRLEYFIYGKTKVKSNICSFKGKIIITGAHIFDSDFPPLKDGIVMGEYEFCEDPNQKMTGLFKGTFKSKFYLDENGKLKYDALNIDDFYFNNQFKGIWESYETRDLKKCNWGDYKFPEYQKIDNRTGKFLPSNEFLDYGWLSYKVFNGIPNKMSFEQAKKEETEKWWLDKE